MIINIKKEKVRLTIQEYLTVRARLRRRAQGPFLASNNLA